MQALHFDGALRLADLPIPKPGAGEALIAVQRAGICNTDLEITRGYGGFRGVLGHEFVGTVVAAEDQAWIGQRVCGEINAACGACTSCRAGVREHCEHRTVLGILNRDGAFAEYTTLPLRNLHPIPRMVTDDEAVFVEPLAAAFQILEQVRVRPTDRVVVLGDGKLGNLCAQVLALTGAELLAIGKHQEKLAILQELGIPTANFTPGTDLQADVVVEVTGAASGVAAAIAMTRPRGTLVLKTTVADDSPVNLSAVVVKELRVVGSRCGPFARAIAALVHREVTVRPLITSRFPLRDGVAAMAQAQQRGAIKVLLDVETGGAGADTK